MWKTYEFIKKHKIRQRSDNLKVTYTLINVETLEFLIEARRKRRNRNEKINIK